MEVTATDMRNAVTSVSDIVVAPRRKTETSRPKQTADSSSVNNEQIRQMVEQMQKHLDCMNVSLQYDFYGEHDEKVAVKVINKETGEVVREIPSKEMQALQAKMRELVGMIFNDEA